MEPVCCPETTERVAIDLPVGPESARRARGAVAPLRHHMGAAAFDDVRLLASELVSDALATERPPADRPISLEAEVLDGATRVAVGFNGLALRVRPRKPELGEPGWGLYLVQQLASRWGARHEDGSMTVWFEVPSGTLPATTA